MAKKKSEPKPEPKPEPKRIPCAFTLPDGHYLENGPYACGFNVKGGKVILSESTFEPMREVIEKEEQIGELVKLHNRWIANELKGLAKIKRRFWERVFDKLSIPEGADATVSINGVVSMVVKDDPKP